MLPLKGLYKLVLYEKREPQLRKVRPAVTLVIDGGRPSPWWVSVIPGLVTLGNIRK